MGSGGFSDESDGCPDATAVPLRHPARTRRRPGVRAPAGADPVFSRARLVEPSQPVLLPGNKLPHVMLNTDPPEHTRLRKLVTRALTARAVERLRPRVTEIAD